MNKQNLWFITLFGLILVLGIYYVTMPNDLLLTVNNSYGTEEDDLVSVVVEEAEIIAALRVTKEEERLSLASDYQAILTDTESTTEEKNDALEMIKSLNEVLSKEESLETKIKKIFKLDCCVQINSSVITATCSSSSHDNSLANKLMRSIQEEFDVNQYITIKFES